MNQSIGDLVAAVRSMPTASATSLALCDSLEEEGVLEYWPGRILVYVLIEGRKVWLGMYESVDLDVTNFEDGYVAGIRWLDGKTLCENLPAWLVGQEAEKCWHENDDFCCLLRIIDNREVKSNGPYTVPCKELV